MHPFIPVLSPSFLYHPYIPSFKSKDFSFTCRQLGSGHNRDTGTCMSTVSFPKCNTKAKPLSGCNIKENVQLTRCEKVIHSSWRVTPGVWQLESVFSPNTHTGVPLTSGVQVTCRVDPLLEGMCPQVGTHWTPVYWEVYHRLFLFGMG